MMRAVILSKWTCSFRPSRLMTNMMKALSILSSCVCDCLTLEFVPAALNYVLRGALRPRVWPGLIISEFVFEFSRFKVTVVVHAGNFLSTTNDLEQHERRT